MNTESFIRKRQSEPDGLDFEGLRQEGIRLVQEYSGDVWTDYNLHDPGVTLLEQICYGLTDLVYRTGFPVADYLVSASGGIDFDKLALHRPDRALASGPVTENDYRKLILDSVPNIDNVWIARQPRAAGGVDGLHRIHLQLSERVKQDHESVEKTYADAVRKLYAANRNLCEDLAEVRLAKRIPYGLRGEIDIDGNRAPASILAEIYFECSRYLSPRVVVRPYQDLFRSGESLERLFAGVVTRCGYIADDDLHPWCGQFSVQELSGRLLGIDGVAAVRTLEFVGPDGEPVDIVRLAGDDPLPVACLAFPSAGETPVRLVRGDKACLAPFADVETEFKRLNYGTEALRGSRTRFDWVDALLPKGQRRPIGRYSSIQEHFPEIYGINAAGIGTSASSERKAAAAQLKAYLLFFEQIMANFLSNAQEIPSLFSCDESPGKSYFHQVLANASVPDAEAVYRYEKTQMAEKLAEVVARFDDFAERKNRVLDYLLGLYGEEFSQNSLRHHFGEEVEHGVETLRNKLAFLKNIVDSGKKRAAAFDYRKAADAGNRSALEKKLAVLLGLDAAETRFHLVEHVLLRPAAASPAPDGEETEDFHSFRFSAVFPADVGRYANPEFRKLVEETAALNCPVHIVPEVFWLHAESMAGFEAAYRAWQEARRRVAVAVADDATADAATDVLRCLREMREHRHE